MDKHTMSNLIDKVKNFGVMGLFLSFAIVINGLILFLYHMIPCSQILDKLSSGEVLASILITFPTIATWISESNQRRSADVLSNYKLRESSFSEQYSKFLNSIDLVYNKEEQNESSRSVQNDDSRLMVELQLKRIKLKDFLQRENKLKEEAKECKEYRYEHLIDFVSLYLFLQTYLSDKIKNNDEAQLWREQVFKPILKQIKDNNESEEIKSLYHSDKTNKIFCIDFSGEDVTDKLLSIPTDKPSEVIFDYCYFTTESITKLIKINDSLLDTSDYIIMNNCAFEELKFEELFTTDEGNFPVQINSYYKDGSLTEKKFRTKTKEE